MGTLNISEINIQTEHKHMKLVGGKPESYLQNVALDLKTGLP